MTSWKTSVFGLMAAIGGAIILDYQTTHFLASLPEWFKSVGALLSIIGTAGVGVFARDNSVTSEQAGAAPAPKAQPQSSYLGANKLGLFLLSFGLGFCLLSTGCASKLAPGGAYAPATVSTNSAGVVSTNATAQPDMGLYLADSAYKLAYDAVDGALKFELDNRSQLQQTAPGIKTAFDKIRPAVWDIEQRWALARQAYKASPTPAGLTNLQLVLAELQKLVPIVQQQLATVPTTTANN